MEEDMDLMCNCCGELWPAVYVVYEQAEGFELHRHTIRACPSCNGMPARDLAEAQRRRLKKVESVNRQLGTDDYTLEDLESFESLGRDKP